MHCPGSWRAPHENAAAQLKRNQKLTTAQLSDIADAHVDACAKALIGINEFNKELDARFAQRTGEETV